MLAKVTDLRVGARSPPTTTEVEMAGG
jgi:hypothetical protein